MDLFLPLKAEYFDQIKAGIKAEEYRRVNDYWSRRLVGKTFNRIVLTKGYPKRTDAERHIVRPWRGLNIRKIVHPHFGPDPVLVFAICVNDIVNAKFFNIPTLPEDVKVFDSTT